MSDIVIEELSELEPLVGECSSCCAGVSFEIEELSDPEPLVGECSSCCAGVSLEDESSNE
ncbi:MAG: hypothetical protein M3198_17005 [Actinomycetota bacterium]|nr:hypothetical protein [Actinomycetota bacterium]